MNEDWDFIKICADLCLRSYDDSSTGFKSVDDLRFGIHCIKDMTFITIRGTANMLNWLKDADALPIRSCSGSFAHKGFVQAYRKLCSGGMPTVKGQNVVATGHSLGGAIATLLSAHTGCKLVTFGSPRVFFRLSNPPKLDHVRVICDDDPVPMVPRILYKHTCKPIVLKDKDDSFIDVRDHFMKHYISILPK